MPPSVEELTEQARDLPPSEKLRLVDALLHQLDAPDTSLDTVWAAEVNERRAAYHAGALESYSYEEVMQSFRAR